MRRCRGGRVRRLRGRASKIGTPKLRPLLTLVCLAHRPRSPGRVHKRVKPGNFMTFFRALAGNGRPQSLLRAVLSSGNRSRIGSAGSPYLPVLPASRIAACNSPPKTSDDGPNKGSEFGMYLPFSRYAFNQTCTGRHRRWRHCSLLRDVAHCGSLSPFRVATDRVTSRTADWSGTEATALLPGPVNAHGGFTRKGLV